MTPKVDTGVVDRNYFQRVKPNAPSNTLIRMVADSGRPQGAAPANRQFTFSYNAEKRAQHTKRRAREP